MERNVVSQAESDGGGGYLSDQVFVISLVLVVVVGPGRGSDHQMASVAVTQQRKYLKKSLTRRPVCPKEDKEWKEKKNLISSLSKGVKCSDSSCQHGVKLTLPMLIQSFQWLLSV